MVTDGRVARRHRNQDTVLDAVIALFDAGQAEPTVDDVSDCSGVSTRSIYRYFHHRDGLIGAALWHLVDRVEEERVLQVGDGELSERIHVFVDHRLAVFGRIAPLVRATNRLARPLSGGSPHGDAEAGDALPGDALPGDAQVGDSVQRPLFAVPPSVAFAADFERIDSATRRIAAISADAMFQFDTLDGLAEVLASDAGVMAWVLERHLRQQTADA